MFFCFFCAVKRFQSFHVGEIVEIAKLAANSLTTGVVESFFGTLFGSLFEFPCPSRAVYLMLQVAKVFAYKVLACHVWLSIYNYFIPRYVHFISQD